MVMAGVTSTWRAEGRLYRRHARTRFRRADHGARRRDHRHFEFDNFLGSPSGHLWISPGGTVEVIESSTRRNLTERTAANQEESTQKIEESLTVFLGLGTIDGEMSSALGLEEATIGRVTD